jgi:predicted acylesterase/phospholipase RssA/CRP-like cAMP-binding protein
LEKDASFDINELIPSARQTLTFIETRTVHVLSHLQAAVSLLLNRQNSDHLVTWDESLRSRLTVENLETHVKQWAFLIPEAMEKRAALVRVLLSKYPFKASDYPQLSEHLGLDDSELQMAYKGLFKEYLQSAGMKANPVPRTQNTVGKLTDILLQDDMGSQLEWLSLRRGETLFEQGDEGDSLYVIMEGLVRVTSKAAGEEADTLIVELGRGEIVGEVALLTGEKRTATVYAARDTQLCKLSKAGFEFLAQKYPIVMSQISIQMARHMLRQDPQQKQFARPVTLTVIPISDGTDDFVGRLVDEFARYGTTVHLNRERVAALYPEKHNADNLDERVDDYEFVAWLNSQESQAQFVIYETDLMPSPWTRRCVEQADRLLLAARADAQPELSAIESTILSQQDAKVSVRRELALLHPNQDRQPTGTQAWLTPRNASRHYHIALDSNGGVERLVRFMRGQAIGVVFGGGGMRGSAHASAIRVLQELGIQVDFVGGASVGAIAATQFAMGWSSDHIMEVSSKRLINSRVLLDYTFPLVAMTAGQRFNRALTDIYGDLRLEDLWLNCFCVSTNLTYGQMRIHQSGLIRRAVRASTALPGIYPPVLDDNGDFLVDGGLINNVPADVMKTAVDGGAVIAIDISREAGRRGNYQFGDSISGWKVLLNRINPFVKTRRYPSIVKTMMRATMIANDATTIGKAKYIDVHLKPPVNQFGLFDTTSSQSIYDIGYQYAKDVLTEWMKKRELPEEPPLKSSEAATEVPIYQ